jgi:hypothetical protein
MAILTPVKESTPLSKEGLVSWDLIERMFNNINALDTAQCWTWKGVLNSEGYGVVRRKLNKKVYGLLVHRVSYYNTFGSIPEGYIVDHSCHNPKDCINGPQCQHRRCYNPHHLRLLTRAENTAVGANPRKNVGVCRNNLHPWTEDNVQVYASGKQVCISCKKEQLKRRQLREQVANA